MIIYSPSKYYTPETEADRGGDFSPIVMRALRARGIVTEEERRMFMHPDLSMLRDPFTLPDMQKAVDRIETALLEGEKICIYGDYDVDGICATTILLHYLFTIGAEVQYKIPSRQDDGYGISRKAIDALRADGVSLIITVDNGISAYQEIEYAKQLGIDVIVTDHHIPPEDIPDCAAVVCHSVEGSEYPRYLCGAGTALKLIQALGGAEAVVPYIYLAGVATVADVVPLVDENRLLVKLALEAMNNGECCLGLRMLLESLPNAKKPYSSFNIGFGIAPRLNASGRMGDASLCVELFMTEDPNTAGNIITELNRLNELRQAEEQAILNEAIAMVEKLDISRRHAILLASDKWNSGVIGIAASRLTEIYNRPAVLFSEHNGDLKGSARSIEGINIHDALKAHSDMFIRFGGHAKAAGVTMEKQRFDEFAEAFEKYLADNCAADLFVPRRCYEFDEDISCLTMEVAAQLEMLAPFGEGNPCPVFHAASVCPAHIRRFGSDGQHLRMDIRQSRFSLNAVYFCGGRNFDRLLSADTVSMLYSPFINRWNGADSVQLRVISARPDAPRCPSRLVKNHMQSFYEAFLCCMAHAEGESELPPLFKGNIAALVKNSFAGLLLLAFSTETAERLLSELGEAGAENYEICFNTLPEGMYSGNALLIAPFVTRLPDRGYNHVVFCDEPYDPGAYAAVRKALPSADIKRMDNGGDIADICSGFNISRAEMGLYYKAVAAAVNTRCYSMPELTMHLCESLSRPSYQTMFALMVFKQLGFITDDGGKAVRIVNNGFRRLDESPAYKFVAKMQEAE